MQIWGEKLLGGNSTKVRFTCFLSEDRLFAINKKIPEFNSKKWKKFTIAKNNVWYD